MMKKLLVAFVMCTLAWNSFAKEKLIFSSTIDFLDYAFRHGDPELGYYKLDDYEAAIRQMAEGGIRKIYLRVNVCGTTHYPSEVSAQYGDNDAYHWKLADRARYLINTFKRYNPCLETIRLGHKYGLAVWAWESLYDDAGVQYDGTGTENCREIYEKLDGWALIDPWYLDNMDAFAMLDPLKIPTEAERVVREEAARRFPIARIVITNDKMFAERPASRIQSAADVLILVSDDNRVFRPYNGTFTVQASETEDKRNRLEISGLDITQKYVKIGVSNMPKDNGYSIVMTHPKGQCQVFNKAGEEVESTWGICSAIHASGALNFVFGGSERNRSFALDYGDRSCGFCVGVPELSLRDKYFYGVAEFTVPKAMEHKVARFIELARYPFDGFMFNTRCHSAGTTRGPNYGFNPEVLTKFVARHGHPYAGTPEDIQGIFQIRGESVAEFFRRCKAESGGRPIYLSGNMPLEMKDDPDYNPSFGPLPWLYKQYFADGSIDGIMMSGRNFRNGHDFSAYFTPEITGGRDIKIGLFREMGTGRPKNYQLLPDAKAAIANGLAEIELYESVCITDGLGEKMVYPQIKAALEE
ncbi:MAG: hypothetical protein IKP00_11675 [Victivallales bacterium]|nr:hypothetical protein [Victivallales bacterium]